jgi:FKBP-type peptidyl-prolyl cis-trans isomerase 2
MRGVLQPGQFVRLDSRPDWGIGQVQSVERDRVTVNFPHAGKVLIRDAGGLSVVAEADAPPADTHGIDTHGTGAR